MNKSVSGGMVAVVLVIVVLILGGLWSVRSQKQKQESDARRATILQGAGGEHPPTKP